MPYRPVEDLAFAVARFYQQSGTLQNYYMVYNRCMKLIPYSLPILLNNLEREEMKNVFFSSTMEAPTLDALQEDHLSLQATIMMLPSMSMVS